VKSRGEGRRPDICVPARPQAAPVAPYGDDMLVGEEPLPPPMASSVAVMTSSSSADPAAGEGAKANGGGRGKGKKREGPAGEAGGGKGKKARRNATWEEMPLYPARKSQYYGRWFTSLASPAVGSRTLGDRTKVILCDGEATQALEERVS
jgi:hypothetical protein